MSSVCREPKPIMRLRSALLAGPAEPFFDANGIWVRYSLPVHADDHPNLFQSNPIQTASQVSGTSATPHLLSSPSPKCYPYVSNPFHLLTAASDVSQIPILLCCPNRQRDWQCYSEEEQSAMNASSILYGVNSNIFSRIYGVHCSSLPRLRLTYSGHCTCYHSK